MNSEQTNLLSRISTSVFEKSPTKQGYQTLVGVPAGEDHDSLDNDDPLMTATATTTTCTINNNDNNNRQQQLRKDPKQPKPFTRMLHTWLLQGARKNEANGMLWFTEENNAQWRPAPLFRRFVYNPVQPEFTRLQSMTWSVLTGVTMGCLTWFWKWIIEAGVEFIWLTVPTALYNAGVFTDVDGAFPLYHYVWFTTAFFGGFLSYMFAVFDILGQNEWISGVHCRGGTEFKSCVIILVLSTVGMWSGLNLGPELPLVIVGGMLGSFYGYICSQSIMQTRVLTVTGASAAVASFFHFPLTGAVFVLEILHRDGMEYHEILPNAIFSSIIGVGVKCMLSDEYFAGSFNYPPLPESLDPIVCILVLFLTLYGCGIGTIYATITKFLKTSVHDWFHKPGHDHATHSPPEDEIVRRGSIVANRPSSPAANYSMTIRHKGIRAALAGAIAGALVGFIGLCFPHTMFWGEAQLQNLIDRGLSPLPIFGEREGPTVAFTHFAVCMVDPSSSDGYSPACYLLIGGAKMITTGLSLGTGILGGQFWGPLFVGCTGGQFLMEMIKSATRYLNVGHFLTDYPTLVLLCTMGTTHVVTFRAWVAICLILTLTICGTDANILPILIMAIYPVMLLAEKVVFYKAQRSRSDLHVTAEALCEPGKEGKPLAKGYTTYDDWTEEESGSEDYYAGSSRGRLNSRSTTVSSSSVQGRLVQVNAFGDVKENPCLMTQARLRAASSSSFMEVCV